MGNASFPKLGMDEAQSVALLVMGLTKLTTDEVIRDDGTRLQKKGSTSAHATNEDIWTI